MRRAVAVVALVAATASAPGAARAADYRDGSVHASVSPTQVVLGNNLVERRWDRTAFRTTALVDRRGRDRVWSAGRRDFSLTVAGVKVGSEALHVESVNVTQLDRGGLRVRMELSAPASVPGLAITRVAEAYPGVAGFRVRDGGGVAGAGGARARHPGRGRRRARRRRRSTRSAPARTGVSPTGRGRRSRWVTRTPGPGARAATPAPAQSLRGAGRVAVAARTGARSLFMVMERNDFPSSRVDYDGQVAGVQVDCSRDVISLGPLEEYDHVENPADGPGPGPARAPRRSRSRSAAVFTGVGQRRRRRAVAVPPLPDRAPARARTNMR